VSVTKPVLDVVEDVDSVVEAVVDPLEDVDG
jgi:hypothetical protein